MSQVRFLLPGSSMPLEHGTTTSSHSADDSPDSQMMLRYIEGEKYKMRHRRLRKTIKAMVFENAALCDEVAKTNEKIVRSKEERRFLLKKLYTFEVQPDTSSQLSPRLPAVPPSTNVSPKAGAASGAATVSGVKQAVPDASESNKSKRKAGTSKAPTKEGIPSGSKTAAKRKRASTATKRLVQPITVDSVGRPAFPIVLGGLTVHSLGEIVSDRSSFYTEEHIYPVGFCSTRIYASRRNAEQKCQYTCKISDGGMGPRFEISADDDPEHPIVADSATECHSNLLRAVNAASGTTVVDITGQGAEFFGFSHPTIQNLVQSSHGARKCSAYKWVKFEVCKPDQVNDMGYCMSDNDACISFDALQRNIVAAAGGPDRLQVLEANDSSNLRNLLINV